MSSVPQSKQELELAIDSVFPKLMADYRSIPTHMSRVCGVEGNIKGTHISVSDTAAYLIGWGKLVLKWYELTSHGLPVDFPDTGYKWNQLGLLAERFHQEYSQWQYADLLNEYELTMKKLLTLIASLSDHQLYGVTWYDKWTLGRMIQFNTYSPMKNMRTKVRRFKKDNALA
ncbi:ClbS/DfsB family four-helix bundle protein [Shewanella profunda]|uniref:ClbS/DfsB family four-helix bundle protein n=1 Tax=Shewanella profunda TaxID=254793 RepID=UPI00200F0DC7|nr:ClbS/DfsB family four-helix bundle protein [Shewanella profunda]MCL1090994.1 ClbS/DfsB family four-helix bundle protein [Shewanella profunda]